jgi:hypothetical protein
MIIIKDNLSNILTAKNVNKDDDKKSVKSKLNEITISSYELIGVMCKNNT